MPLIFISLDRLARSLSKRETKLLELLAVLVFIMQVILSIAREFKDILSEEKIKLLLIIPNKSICSDWNCYLELQSCRKNSQKYMERHMSILIYL